MTTLEMHVVSNGELAKAALNAIVTLLSTDTFATAIKLSILFSIIGAGVNYIRGRDIIIFARWFITYFAITTLMLVPKVNLEIIDSSNPGAVLTAGNVPYGFAYPAHLITSTAHGLVSVFEEAFSMPDDFSYNKTGMLFGSKLFRLSTEFHIINPETKAQVNEFVKNCVLGDILINKKYSMMDLTESGDLLGTITKNPSKIRGIYVGEVFKTCAAAAIDLKKNLETDINTNGFKIFGKQIFGNPKSAAGASTVVPDAEKLKRSLQSVYGYFNYGGLSNNALEIMTQNLMINGIKDGLLNYTAETGATAALLNLSTTQAMERMRMSMATSRNIATYAIPVMHTVLLLLMLSLFPVIILLAFQPSFTVQVLKNYFYTLIWIESWPLMFACLNLVVTFYTKSEIGAASLTISNMNQLALEHSDVANMAGYLMMAIPFISGGLVMGMASAFNSAASYVGGVLQSSASSAASEAASGNISVGNSSWANVNANKFDTNSTLMQGMSTEQLKTGVLRTTRSDGGDVYDSGHAFSKLPVNVRASDVLSESFSSQAEAARSATIQDQRSYDQAISNSISDLNSISESYDSRQSHGEGFSSREAASSAQSVSDMKGLAQSIAKRNHVDADDVFRGLVNFSQGGKLSVGGSISGKALGINVADGKIGLDGKVSLEHTRSSESSTRHGVGRSIDITADEARRFSSDLHRVQEYAKTQHAETSHSVAESQLFQLSSNLNKAQTASEHYSAHQAESERLSSSATFVRQHSGQIDSDLGQEVADAVVKKEGREAAEALFGGKDRARLEADVREYVQNSGLENKILSNYQHNSSGINPSQKFHSGTVEIANKKSGIIAEHEERNQNLEANAKAENTGFKAKAKNAFFKVEEFDQIKDNTNKKYNELDGGLKKTEESQNNKYNRMKAEVSKDIKEGTKRSKSTTGDIKPEFLEKEKGGI